MNIDIIDKYNDKVLAVESFGENEKVYVQKFLDEDNLIHYLYMLNTHELSLREDGLNFLKEFYTLDKVIDIIMDAIKDGIDFKYIDREDIRAWLERKGEIDPSGPVTVIPENL